MSKARTVAVLATERIDVEVLSVDAKKTSATIAIHGGIRRGVSADKAKKAVETMVN